MGLALDLNGLEQALVEAFGSSPIGAVFGLEEHQSPPLRYFLSQAFIVETRTFLRP